jgi:adenylylsulfate kinase-like enzyme
VSGVKGYKLDPEALSLEKGEGANPSEVTYQAGLISSGWNPKLKSENPLILLIGGFQGSGKTTVMNLISSKLDLTILSPDQIRHNLFEQGYKKPNDFRRLINATKYELVKRALNMGISITLDQALTPDRVKLIKEAAASYPNFKVKSVFLLSPIQILRERVRQRPGIDGYYKGTLTELENSIKNYIDIYGEPKKEDYDLTLDSSKEQPEALASQIISSFQLE